MPIPGVTVEDVDAYSDVSNGSTISVGSAASGGGGHMPRPPTGDSRRSKSMQGRRSRVAKSPYSSSQLKGYSKQQPPKPTARNMWITAMRNGIGTLSTENSPMKTWAGPRSSYNKQMKTGTRARHLSDFVPTEDLKSKNHVRSASMSASQPQLTGGGGPAYKPQEDYYDEIIELKKIINALKAENNVINTKLHRVEGENVLKDRKMEDLLNNRKQPEDVRRTLTDKKGDTSAIVNSLKQKLHAVERTVKDKEAELSQLKKDIKMTNIEELQIQSETYYQEFVVLNGKLENVRLQKLMKVQRLQLAVLEMQQSQVHDHYGRASSPRGSKGKPSTLTLQRLAEENDHLKAENRSLKKDLLTAIENSSSGNKKVTLKTEYADMNRGQLLAKIHELEEKVQDSDGKKTFPRKGSSHEDKEADVEGSSRKSISKLTEVPGRIELRGTTSQKLTQLQEREVELLEEREKQREIIERLKEDRAHYRSVADDLRLQLKSTQDEQDRLGGEKSAVGERKRSSTSLSSLRRLSLKESRPRGDNDDDLDRMLNDFQQQRAAKALQRQWRGYRGRKQQAIQDEEMEKNKAAVTLQKNWRRHRNRTKQVDDESKEEAITEIQAALRGQAVRNKYLEQLDKDLEMTDRDDAIVAIQSAMRGHWARKKHLGGPGDELASRDTRTRGSSSHILLGSEPESDDDLVIISSSGKRHPEPAMTSPRRRSLTDPQESTERVALAASPRHVAAIERNPVLARDKALESAKVARGQEYAPAPLARDKALVPTALPRGKALPRNHELAHNEGRDSSSALARDKTLVPKALPRGKANARDETLARDQAREQSALVHVQSESDLDDDAVVIGRSARSRTGNQKKENTHLNLNKYVERNQRTSDVNKKDLLEENAKKTRGKKKPAKESAKNEIEDGTEENNKTEGSRRLISAPKFSNISELSEDEDSSPTRSKSNQNRFGGLRNEFAHKETEQRPKKKNFEIVDSDDDDDDDAVISRPRRTLDTGMSRQQPSLSRSNRPISPPGTSESRPGLSRSSRGVSPPDTSEDRVRTIESRSGLSRSSRGVSPPDTSEDRVRTIESRPGSSRSSRGISATNDDRVKSVGGRPGLSRASGNLAAKRDVDDSDSGMEESSQRPGLSRSKRPLSGQRPGFSRSGSRDKEKESPRASGSGRSRMLADSEEDSDEDDVIITGKKTKNTGGDGKARGRPSLTRKSPASTLPASSQRNTLASSLDNFFSKGSSGKKSPRKTHAEVQESDDDDDDDDMVVSSLSKYKSKQKEPSRDSVAGLWATSDKGSDSNKRKSSVKSSKRNTWSPDFGFEKPARRPDSRLDELF